jgi:gliding motility-associated-like protein
MNKIYVLSLSFILLFFVNSFSQNVVVEIDGDNLSYTEPGCSDCYGDPDPRWRAKVTTNSGSYNWNVNMDDVCGWVGATNFNWVAPQVQPANSTITMAMDGFESDGFICGSDDNVCGGYSNIGSVVINSNPPCTWNFNTYQKVCGSGTYAIRWSYYWYYQTISPGTIVGDDTICAGDDPDTLGNVTSGSPFSNYQWQYSDDSAATWNNMIGETGLSTNPPAGLIATRWYRRLASTCGGTADTASNIVIITVNPSPVATVTPVQQGVCSGDSTSLILTNTLIGTTYAWTVTQTNPTGASAGSDSVIIQQLTSTGIIPDTVKYTIVPTNGLCVGAPITASVIVTPIPVVTATPPAQTFCSGDTTSIALSSTVSNTLFSWSVFLAGVTGGTVGSDSASLTQILYNNTNNAGAAIYSVTSTLNGCSAPPINITITVNPSDDASFTYPSATFCQSGANPTPTITGIPGGVFSSSPVGLVINPATGVINLATSTLGQYILRYSSNGLCHDSSSIVMTIDNATPSAVFNYANPSYCQNGTNPFPIYDAGASAGIYSAVPAGLVFAHINTGEIDLLASAPGTYVVTNNIPPSGSCLAASATTVVTILASDDASFIYPSATYCTSGTPQTPTVTGLAGGVFAATPVGLAINSTTGTINLSTSTLGGYIVSYTTNGACPNSSAITMTITNNTPAAGFSYIGAPFCQNGNDPFPLFVAGASAGMFSATPAGLVFDHVNTGQVDVSASTPGTYTVTNTIPVSGTCGAATATATITISPADDASFVYSSGTYCTSAPNQTPVITGISGGAFTSVPVGLSINPGTGTINIANSVVGSYLVTYTTGGSCSNSSAVTITIIDSLPSALFSYPSPTYCQNVTNPHPVFVPGSSAGIFSAAPVGLTFVNVNTGEIDLSSSAAGIYIVTNTIPANGSCAAISAMDTITINASDNAAFVYTSATYCTSGSNQTPTITGLAGGVFSSIPSGLSINPSTGIINLATSTLGVYTLSYSTNGSCPNTSSITMTITNTTPAAAFNYNDSPFCQNITDPFPAFAPGASAGIFSATPVGLVFDHVNTGQINLSASTPGTYVVTNNIPMSGTCNAVSASDTIIINSPDNASFVYSSATYCTSGANPTPAITGLTGGVFMSVPPGLVINPATGEINLATSSLGSYTLSYTTNGSCPNTSSITMTIINANPAATFSYSNATFCQNGTDNSLPVFGGGASAGIFTATPAGLSFVHVNTGEIDLSGSAPGVYTVTNTIPVSGTCTGVSATSTVVIVPADDASFTYSSATYCTSGINPTPVITGLPGGTFSSVPVGLSINPATGTINLFTSVVGTYTLTYTTIGTCPNTFAIQMTIADTTPSANFTYPGVTFCQGVGTISPLFASGSSAGVFSSSPAIGLVFVNVNTGQINLDSCAAGTYTITNSIPASGSCLAATATTTLTINPGPIVTASPTSQTICIGGTTAITFSSTINGTSCAWTVVETGVSGASPGNGPSIQQTLNITGTGPGVAVYTITSSFGGCVGEPIVVPITVNLLPIADTSGVVLTPSNCGGPSGGVSGITMATGQAPFHYVWKDPAGNIVGNTADLSGVIPGLYTLTVTDSNSCTIIAGSFAVNATPPIIAQFTADTLTGETPLTINFANGSTGATNYHWDFGTGDTSNLQNPSYTYIPLGEFTVCLTAISATGCIDTACSIVDVFLNSVFIIPNIFTPNDDNINDIFTVQGVGLVKMDAEIYNRWGEKIYEWHTVSGGWNGRTTSGIQASDGTYYYVVRAKGIDQKDYFNKGSFTLIRSK